MTQQLQFNRTYSGIENDADDEFFSYKEGSNYFTTTVISPINCSNNSFNPNFYNPFEIKHRKRTSRGQFRILEKAFANNPKPNSKARQALADTLSMTPRGVQVWFQNRRAKAKQQQQSKKLSHDHNIVDKKLQVTSSPSPIILSSSGLIHSRSQSSSSSSSSSSSTTSTTFSAENTNSDLHVMLSSAASLPLPPPQPQVWHSGNSDAASTVTITSSSPLLLTPPQPQLEIAAERNRQQDDYCLWMDNNEIHHGHQTLFSNNQQQQQQQQVPAAAVVNDVIQQHTMKSDPFTAAHATNVVVDQHHLDAWVYLDSLQTNSNQQHHNLILDAPTFASKVINNNVVTYNCHVADWISSTKAACSNDGFDNNLLFILDNDHTHQHIQQQQQYQQLNKISNKPSSLSAEDNSRRHSYPLMPANKQQESYWTTTDQQVSFNAAALLYSIRTFLLIICAILIDNASLLRA